LGFWGSDQEATGKLKEFQGDDWNEPACRRGGVLFPGTLEKSNNKNNLVARHGKGRHSRDVTATGGIM